MRQPKVAHCRALTLQLTYDAETQTLAVEQHTTIWHGGEPMTTDHGVVGTYGPLWVREDLPSEVAALVGRWLAYAV